MCSLPASKATLEKAVRFSRLELSSPKLRTGVSLLMFDIKPDPDPDPDPNIVEILKVGNVLPSGRLDGGTVTQT